MKLNCLTEIIETRNMTLKRLIMNKEMDKKTKNALIAQILITLNYEIEEHIHKGWENE